MNIEQEIEKKAREIIKARRRLFVIRYISKSKKSVCQECEEFGVSKSTFYAWRKRYELEGEDGLKRKKPIANNHPKKISQNVIDKILELRTIYQLGSIRISWYLERYHEINVSESSVTRILARKA